MAGAASIAVVHALIPSHWLSFALVARAQRWTVRRALIITAAAGSGHVLMTLVLGAVGAVAGKAILARVPESLEHAITAGSLIALGLFFAIPALRGHSKCEHDHDYGLSDAKPGDLAAAPGREPTVMGALVLGLTLSPCLDLLPVYVAASGLSWSGIALIGLLMAAVTLTLMLALVWAALKGMKRLNLGWLEENERLAVGSILVILGVVLLFV